LILINLILIYNNNKIINGLYKTYKNFRYLDSNADASNPSSNPELDTTAHLKRQSQIYLAHLQS
jgi:hypothetical protein